MLTDTHPTATRITLTLPKELLKQVDKLAIDSEVHRSEMAIRLLRRGLALQAREGEE